MLEELSPREFEGWTKLVLERYFGCRVEETPYVADGGRDLLVHHPDGLIVVECKHQRAAVGRPVVQKLHSAMVTAGARKGLIVTSGLFSDTAAEYAKSLPVTIELIDGARLSSIAASVGISARGGDSATDVGHAIITSNTEAFKKRFPSVILQGRSKRLHPTECERRTDYEPYYIAQFSASGEVTAAGTRETASWSGLAWIAGDGSVANHGAPPRPDVRAERIGSLSKALQKVPGGVILPSLPLHEAPRRLKEYLRNNLAHSITYYGGNNRRYTKSIRPRARDTHVQDLGLIHVPRQRFRLAFLSAEYTGEVYELGRSFFVQSSTLGACSQCKRPVKPTLQCFCDCCGQSLHRRSFLHPCSFECKNCGSYLCWEDSRRSGVNSRCPQCDPVATRKAVRRAPQIAVAGIGSILAIASADPTLIIAGLIAAWLPFAYVSIPGRGADSTSWNEYRLEG